MPSIGNRGIIANIKSFIWGVFVLPKFLSELTKIMEFIRRSVLSLNRQLQC